MPQTQYPICRSEVVVQTTLQQFLVKLDPTMNTCTNRTSLQTVIEKIKTHFLSDEIFPTLSDEERAECDTAISNTELTNALNLLNKDLAQGSDGLPPSVHKQFWEKLKGPLL